MGEAGQGGAQQESPQRAVQSDLIRPDDHQKQPADEEAEGELGHAQDTPEPYQQGRKET